MPDDAIEFGNGGFSRNFANLSFVRKPIVMHEWTRPAPTKIMGKFSKRSKDEEKKEEEIS